MAPRRQRARKGWARTAARLGRHRRAGARRVDRAEKRPDLAKPDLDVTAAPNPIDQVIRSTAPVAL